MNCLCSPSRIITIRIVLLDESEFHHEIRDDLPGQAILDIIFIRLNLAETGYFGCRYLDNDNQTHWLDASMRISRQFKHSPANSSDDVHNLYFGVKFYAADPCKLIEEITRYQLYLQVKQDVLQGRLPVSFELASELGAFVVQSELGDYDGRRHSHGYVSEFRLVPNQTKELEQRISEIHQQLKGISPTSAELKYLDKVKWHDMYGVDLHPVLGEDSVEYYLGLTPSGVIVLRNKTTVAHYYWPRIGKVFYKGKYFMLRVCDKNNEINTYGFETPKKAACKHLHRCCVEHHAFFRLVQTTIGSPNGDIYGGANLSNAFNSLPHHNRAPPTFTRLPSNRQLRSFHEASIYSSNHNSSKSGDMYIKRELHRVSIPQNLNQDDNNNNRTQDKAPGSPQSSRSMSRSRSQQRGLFGVAPSPRSMRSASRTDLSQTRGSSGQNFRQRSSSVESQSSNDSRSCRRYKSGSRNRRQSDNESELSRGSGKSGHSHRKQRRHRSRKSRRNGDSGSENESIKSRNYSGHRPSKDNYELVDSELQWREVQRKQSELKEITSGVQQAAVTKSSHLTNHSSSKANSHKSSTLGGDSHRSRKHRRHRSPGGEGTGNNVNGTSNSVGVVGSGGRHSLWNSELAKHLQFDLIDTTGMSEDQLREIPYTIVETTTPVKLPSNSSSSLKVHKHTGLTGHRMDRIRPTTTSSVDGSNYKQIRNGFADGSIRSASTVTSSRDDPQLRRMMSNVNIDKYLNHNGHQTRSPLDMDASLRVSHEHTDSGLGAEQDYAYSSERSNDSKSKCIPGMAAVFNRLPSGQMIHSVMPQTHYGIKGSGSLNGSLNGIMKPPKSILGKSSSAELSSAVSVVQKPPTHHHHPHTQQQQKHHHHRYTTNNPLPILNVVDHPLVHSHALQSQQLQHQQPLKPGTKSRPNFSAPASPTTSTLRRRPLMVVDNSGSGLKDNNINGVGGGGTLTRFGHCENYNNNNHSTHYPNQTAQEQTQKEAKDNSEEAWRIIMTNQNPNPNDNNRSHNSSTTTPTHCYRRPTQQHHHQHNTDISLVHNSTTSPSRSSSSSSLKLILTPIIQSSKRGLVQ